MKDKSISEEKLYDELDAMYRRVADLQGKEAAPEEPIRQQEDKWTADQPASTGDDIPEMLAEPLRNEQWQHKKWSYRRIIVITLSFPLILLVSISVIKIVKLVIASKSPHLQPIQSSTRAIPTGVKETASGLPPVQTEQEAIQEIEAKEERKESVPQGITKPDVPVAPQKYYAIQVGVFRHLGNANELIEVFKEKGLDAYWVNAPSRSGAIFYKVLVGRFVDRNEAAKFAKDESILNDYPDSFVLPISPSIKVK